MDNYYANCPPRMDDGRFLTNYKSSTHINEHIKYLNGIVRNDDYRLYLQLNGDKIQDNNWMQLKKNNSCWNNSCVHKYPLRMDPYLFSQERRDSDEQLKDSILPNSFKCEMYADYRMTQTPLQNYNVNDTTCKRM